MNRSLQPRWWLGFWVRLGLVVVLAVGGGVLQMKRISDQQNKSRQMRMAASPAFVDGRFRNEVPTELIQRNSGGIFARFFFGGDGQRIPDRPLPTIATDPNGSTSADELAVTWLGHSSVIVDIEGRRILCDPVWAERSSPVQFLGPRRFHPPPVALSQLRLPDLVVISHDHYDHLDRSAIEVLAARGTRFAVPLGIGSLLEEWGVPAAVVTELDWWDRLEVVPGELSLVAVPARHFSGRVPWERNRTLWTAWAILGRNSRVFFGGDGGLYDGFAQIGQRLGPFDLTALEIGASDPAWEDIHLGPVNAVTAHRMLRGGMLLPIHWATFNLGLHSWFAPAETLFSSATNAGVELALPRIGETFIVGRTHPSSPWWREVLP